MRGFTSPSSWTSRPEGISIRIFVSGRSGASATAAVKSVVDRYPTKSQSMSAPRMSMLVMNLELIGKEI